MDKKIYSLATAVHKISPSYTNNGNVDTVDTPTICSHSACAREQLQKHCQHRHHRQHLSRSHRRNKNHGDDSNFRVIAAVLLTGFFDEAFTETKHSQPVQRLCDWVIRDCCKIHIGKDFLNVACDRANKSQGVRR